MDALKHYCIERVKVIFRLILLILLISVAAFAASDKSMSYTDIVILPFANNTLDSRVHQSLEIPLINQLENAGFNVLKSSDIRPLLRKHRIRSRGWIGQKAAELITKETGASCALIGSWNIFRIDNNIEIGFSMRLLDLKTMEIVNATTIGVTGEDHVGLFGTGRVSSIDVLANQAIKTALDELFLMKNDSASTIINGCPNVALIPLSNSSTTKFADYMISNTLLTQLHKNGFKVLEPGFVRELGLSREVITRGEIDNLSAMSLVDNYDTCWLITGYVELMEVAKGAPETTFPEISISLRVIDPVTGLLVFMQEITGKGSQTDGILQIGRTHSLQVLSRDLLNGFVKQLQQLQSQDSNEVH
jgi:hypothetical protein